MEPLKNIQAMPVLLIILSSLIYPIIFFDSAQAICVPRNNTHGGPSSAPRSSSLANAHDDSPVSHIAATPSSSSYYSPESAPASSYYPPNSPSSNSYYSPQSAPTSSYYPPNSPSPNSPSSSSYNSPESAPSQSQYSPGPSPFSHLPSKGTPTRPIISPISAPAPDSPAAPMSSQDSQPSAPPESMFNFPLMPALKKICEVTDYPLVCLASTAPFVTGKVDVITVLQVALKACSSHTRMALSIASKVLKTQPGVASAVSDCMEMYNDVLDNIDSAVEALATHDIGTFNTMLSAILTDFGTCEDGFTGEKSPLSEVDDKGTKLASNCLAIASLIK